METPVAEVQHWDNWNVKYRQPGMLDGPSTRRMDEILTTLRQLNVRSANLLEVGCGTGWLSCRLTEFGKVTAVDLGRGIIDAARTRYPEIDFHSGDIQTLALPESFFDVIISVETFSHVPDQPLFLRRLFNLIKPGGFLILTSQNKYVFDRRADVGANVGYIRKWVTMKTLKQMLRTDFDIKRATTLEPEGHLGILRIVNSQKLNKVFNSLLGASRVRLLKEKRGFGQTLFVVAVKRG